MTARERIYTLIDKYAAGTATPAEQEELAQLLEQPAGDQAAKEYLFQLLQHTTPQPIHSDARWQAIQAAIRPVKKKSILFSPILQWTAAAALIAFIIAGYLLMPGTAVPKQQPAVVHHDRPPGGNVAMLTLSDGSTIALDSVKNGELIQQGNTKIAKLNGQLAYHKNTSSEKPASLLYNTLTTPRGGQYRLTLPDGTGVWLNAASSITYPTDFTEEERAVRISGEVYFEVVKETARPFKVTFHTISDSGAVEVLGTHFNINAYKDEDAVKTTLLEGSVRIVGKEATLLKPGQQAQVDDKGKVVVIPDADIDEAMAWKNGRFHFEDADIRTVMRQIARWYDVEVVFEGNVTTEKFVGDIPRNSRLTDVFKILELSNVHFKVEDKKVTVMP